MHRIAQRLAGNYTVTATAYDDDGAIITLTGTPTAVITDGAGATITSSGTVSVTGSGTMSLSIGYATLPLLDTYTVTWTAAEGTWVTRFELCGGFLCEIADIRAEPGMSDTTAYPTATLRTARTKAEVHIEQLASCAFVPRGGREIIIVQGQPYGYVTDLWLDDPMLRSVYSITVDGTALTAEELADVVVYEYGKLYYAAGFVDGAVVVVHYEHGYDETPGPIAEGCARQTVRYAIKNQLGGRRTLESTDLGTMRLTYGTRAGETGDADLDAAIADFGHKIPSLG